MRNALALVLLFASANLVLLAQTKAPIPATTNDGRHVLLNADGTWSYVREKVSSQTPALSSTFKKSASATAKVDVSFGRFTVSMNPEAWSVAKTERGRVMLQSTDGKAYALVVSEAIAAPTSALREAALHNMREKDANMQVLSEEKRVVNGREVLVMEMSATVSKIPFIFYGYYYGGSSGNIQVVTYTTQTEFAPIKGKLTEFLNGLEINDEPITEAPENAPQMSTLSLNEGKMRVVYDEKKWTLSPTRKNGKISLESSKGNGWALIIPEKISVPLDSLPDIALNNAKEAAPDAKVVSREKKVIQGRDVWALRIAGTVNTLPFIYHGYYYSGPGGTVQIITYTLQSNFAEVEPDFIELLNGLQFDVPTSIN